MTLRPVLALVAFALAAPLALGQCTITSDTLPPGVNSGATHNFTATCGTGVSWSVTGSGSINSSTGVYTAPATVQAPNQDRGCQVSPLNSPFNVRVDGLGVHAKSSQWLTRITQDGPQYALYHSLKVYAETLGFYSNPITSATPTQTMHFYYAGNSNGYQDTPFPIPPAAQLEMENGFSSDAFAGQDRHLLSMLTDTCQQPEMYNLYFDFPTANLTAGNPTNVSWSSATIWPMPQRYQVIISGLTGLWAPANGTWRITPLTSHTGTIALNSSGFGTLTGTLKLTPSTQGCNTCNSQSGQKFSPASYAQLGGVDAAQMPIGALSAKLEEWYAATRAGRSDLGHAIRTTLSNFYLTSRHLWPAAGQALGNAGYQYILNSCTAGNPTVCTTPSYADLGTWLPCPNYGYANGIATVAVAAGGTGYAVGQTFNVPGGLNGLVYVTSISSGGVITGLAIDYRGRNYTAGTYSIGSGGATATITVSASCSWPVTVYGLTGTWLGMNGDRTATSIDSTHLSIAYNSTGAGTCTLANGNCTSGSTYVLSDWLPYGTTIRLKASFNVDAYCTSTSLDDWCPYAKLWLRTVQRYGLIVADGTDESDNWNSSTISSEFRPAQLINAASAIRHNSGAVSIQPIEQYLEVVDRSSQNLSTGLADYQRSSVNRTFVTVTGSGGSASLDVLLQGATLGTYPERLTLAASATYQLNVWINGTTHNSPTTDVTYSIDNPGTGAVSSSGLVTAAACSTTQRGTVTVMHATDATALPLYIPVTCVPRSTDGAYRLALGNYSGNFTDSAGQTWWGASPATSFNTWYEHAGVAFGSPMGTWQGYSPCANDPWTGVDAQLYSRSLSAFGWTDLPLQVELAPGTYTYVLYGEPGFGGYGLGSTCGNSAGKNVYDLQAQGTTALSWQDGFVLAGNQAYAGYTQTGTATVDTNGLLNLVLRARQHSTYGVSISSLLLQPTSTGAPVITTSACPPGTVNVIYTGCTLTATGGTPPYTWSSTGTIPLGLTLNTSTGAITGTPTAAGTYTPSFIATDSASRQSVPQQILFTIAPPLPVPACFSGNCQTGTVGVAFAAVYTATGGTGPYTFATLSAFGTACSGHDIAGVTMSAAGNYTGTPTTPGQCSVTVQAIDALHNSGTALIPYTIYANGALAVTTATLPAGTVGIPYLTTIVATGGRAPYTWCVIEANAVFGCDDGTRGALPLQLQLATQDSLGVLSGLPQAPSSKTFTVRVRDSLGAVATRTLTLTVTPPGQFGVVLTGHQSLTGHGSLKTQ